ncbi:hypothetical protein [Halogeometricum limi]|uniref:Uncharacterized protein n=1 Tax=Halogeometricum limi TaxID=555875 RepID=A0A1I6H6N4_9EURY|nr:hypothetical protein [Halogeometricum limi]SFR49961.1 hypothetical protein SAMN04488124_1828 [Halogeometricum limi]
MRKRTTFVGLTAVVHVALAAWIRRDAGRRGIDPSPWDAVALVGGVLGVVGYRRSREN